jgi:acyl-CoA dehydrogenase
MFELAALILCVAVVIALSGWRAPPKVWAATLLALALASQITLVREGMATIPFRLLNIVVWLLAAMFVAVSIPPLRRKFVVTPIFHALRRAMPRVTDTARQALDSGSVGFEAEFFAGKPDWQKLRAVPPITLSSEEAAFLDGPTERLCGMIDDWQIRHQRKEIPEDIWNFLKTEGFLGLRIARQHGGLGFSAQAVSLILGKVASRSPDVFAVLMIPNTLGLGELIETFGTEAQKRDQLPRLARGEEIPCLALTSPASGSDAATMSDIGTIARGIFDGVETLGIRLSWDKRYITLAPDATLIGLAFRCFDPDHLLGKGEDIGISIAIVPAGHPGVQIGRRHVPSGGAFGNGPTKGRDVFIPLAWVIGGDAMLGQGWRMMMGCLSASRAIAIPSCSAAGAKVMLRVSTAYGRIRRQFGSPIARMEGIEEPLARIIEFAYIAEASRAILAAIVTCGEQPSVISALVKYQLSERLRGAANDAMDLHGGRAFFDGPSNYLQSVYQMVPAAITIEGPNIVTRALIVFTQGVLRSHPYLPREIDACMDENEAQGLASFETAFLGHIGFAVSNLARALLHNATGGRFCHVPDQAPQTAEWYRQLSRASRNFALIADLTVLLLGRKLRTKQKLTGRLADALSELFLLSCGLKRYEDDCRPDDDRQILAFAAQNGLYRFQEAIRGTIDNFPIPWARLLMRFIVFPFGLPYRPAPDWLGHKIVSLAAEPGETRDRLTRYIYVSRDENDISGLLELALEKAIKAEEAAAKIDRAAKRGIVRRYHGIDFIADAVAGNVISEQEARLLREANALAARVVAVDDFDPDELRPNYMRSGHNTKAVQNAAGE